MSETIKIDVAKLGKGSILSETTRYIVEGIEQGTDRIVVRHFESGEKVALSRGYITDLLVSGDQYVREEVVGKEDKYWTPKQIEEGIKSGKFTAEDAPSVNDVRTPGIRTIFESISTEPVCTVTFITAGKKRTQKEIKDLLDKQAEEVEARIEKARKNKKSMKEACLETARWISENPVTEIAPGYPRTLRGYKTETLSRDGKYKMYDMDEPDGAGKYNLREVNLNTITSLIYKGVKYVLEKQK